MTIQALLEQYGTRYLQSLLTTWRLTAISFAMAFLLGIIITVMRVAPIKPMRAFAETYVQIFRNIPGSAMLILLVYAFPYIKLMWPYETCLLIVTSMIPSAFCSENLIAGMNTIDPGQIEAARSLGMTFFQMIRSVVLPQAFRSTVLQMTNLLVATMLTTALASQVPLNPTDLTGIVSYINSRSVGGVTAFLVSAVLYCATAVLIGQVGNLIDRKVRILR